MQIGSNFGASSVFSAGAWGDYGADTAEAGGGYADYGFADGYDVQLSADAAAEVDG